MITLFRQIRQKLLQQNRITQYLTYAIGEIFLVVIGILIALSINTWNENLKDRNKEELILKDLHIEFQKNKEKLETSIKHHKSILGGIREIMGLIGEPESVLQQHNVDSLIYLALDYDDFSPSQTVISELISSGKLNLISSDNLRMLIFEWVSAMEEKEEGYQTMDEMSQTQTLPFITKNGTMKNIDQYGILKNNGRSKFNSRNHQLFQVMEFENHIDNQAWGITNYLFRLERLETIIDNIINDTYSETLSQK